MVRFVIIASLACAACGDPWIKRDTQVGYAPTSDTPVLAVTAPIVTDRFPETVAETTHNDCATLVIDLTPDAITYRQFIGIDVVYDEDALTVTASFAEPPCRDAQFAYFLTDTIRDSHQNRIGRTRTFDNAFELRSDDETHGIFGPLRAALVDAGVELGTVAGATLFETTSCD